MPAAYAELHCISNFTFLRGASRAEELVERAKRLGYAALAITDECSLAGIVRAHVAAKEHGLKLIVGAEFRLDDDLRFVLLAQNREGYGNLSELITRGRRNAQKGEYRLSRADLGGGLDACLALWLPPAAPRIEDACWLAERFPGRTWIAIELLARGADWDRLDALQDLARRTGLPCVASGDVHMHVRSRRALQDTLTAIRLGVPVARVGRALYPSGERHLRRRETLAGIYPKALLEETLRIAQRCDFSLDSLRYEYPEEIVPPGLTAAQYLRQLVEEGLRWRFAPAGTRCEGRGTGGAADPALVERSGAGGREDKPFSLREKGWDEGRNVTCIAEISIVPEPRRGSCPSLTPRPSPLAPCEPEAVPAKVRAQVEHELALIAELGYEPYFLTVHDIVKYARSRGILCQGRGSAANSAVCYALGITEVDPARMQMLFERFISRERNEPPDIDVDFEHQRREEVIQYLYAKYGRERAAIAATVITYRSRSAFRDVGKALGLDLAQVDRISKSFAWWDKRDERAARLHEAGFDPESPVIKKLVWLTDALIGFPRHLSQHVGGFVISRGPVSRLVPVENASMADRTIIQWDKDDLDALGLLKVDVLALGMLSAIRRALDMVSRIRGRPFTMADIPAEDPAVYAMLQKADSIGVFQIESRAQISMLPRLKPACYYDLVIEVAIVRPGPIQGGMVHPYLRRRQKLEPVTYPSEAVKAVLERTLGVPIFQEQVMQLAVVAAGFTPGEADQLRRSMAAWRRKGGLELFEEKLITGMRDRGYSEAFAQQIYKQILGFGEYGFPESHSASFALLVYVSAWLKCHEHAAFTCALLNSQPMGFYAPSQLVQDAQRHGVEILPVDILVSSWDCTLEPISTRKSQRKGAKNAEDAKKTDSECSNQKLSMPVTGFSHSQPAIRLGLRMVSGLSESAAERLIALRDKWKERMAASNLSLDSEPLRITHLYDLSFPHPNPSPGGRRAFSPSPPGRGAGGEGRKYKELEYPPTSQFIALAPHASPLAPHTSHLTPDFESLALEAGLTRHDLRCLAEAGALESIAGHRRNAAWSVAGIEQRLPIFQHAPIIETGAMLEAPTEGQDIVADYASLGLTLRRHPLALLRPRFAKLRMTTARDLLHAPSGRTVRVAGLVTCRQRPGTASGVIFVTLEDETGQINVVVWRDISQKQRRPLLAASLLGVQGRLEREGEVTHLIAGRLTDYSALLGELMVASRDFH